MQLMSKTPQQLHASSLGMQCELLTALFFSPAG